jgi:hypothetical protein
MRISFACSLETLREAATRIDHVVRGGGSG